MRLDGERVAPERGAESDAGRGRIPLTGDVAPRGIDTCRGNAPPREDIEVDRGETEPRTRTSAMDDPAASSRRPWTSASRMRLEETIAPPRVSGSTVTTSKPWSAPYARRKSRSPVRRCPTANPGPVTRRRTGKTSTSASQKRSAVHVLSSWENCRSTTLSTPLCCSSCSRSSTAVSIGGQRPGSTTHRGWGSNVITTETPRSRCASSMTRSSSDRWPRCTPSYVPMVSTTGLAMSPRAGSPWMTPTQPASTLDGRSRPLRISAIATRSPAGSITRHSPAASGCTVRGSQIP